MSHLTCQDHKRRVHLIDASATIVHRQDSSTCTSALVTIGGTSWTSVEILLRSHRAMPESLPEDAPDKPKPARLARGERKRRRRDSDLASRQQKIGG
jgi:hypothetical protein